MKRAVVICAIAVGTCLFTACPPQNSSSHSAKLAWHAGGVYSPSVVYRIYRGLSCNALVLGSTVPQSTTTVTDASVVSGVSYCYAVAAFDPNTGLESRTAPQSVVIP